MSLYRVGFNKSSVNNFPSVRPTLDLDFANSKTLDPRITFTRSSGGSYVGADGLIKYAGVNEARFDHNPATGESLGLLMEEARTNLVTYSEQFDDASWGKTAATVTANTTTAPDNTTTADTLTKTGSTGFISKSTITVLSGVSHTLSVYAKANSMAWVALRTVTGFTDDYFYFNLSTGDLGQSATAGSQSIQELPNGWYRCSVTVVTTGTSCGVRIYGATGDEAPGGTGTIFIWGAQLEAGPFPTSYIPTVASTRTRDADVASIFGSNFTSFYSPNKGTFFVQASIIGENNNTSRGTLVSLGTTTNNNFGGFLDYDNRLNVGFIAPSQANISQFDNLTGTLLKGATGFDDALTDNAASASAINGRLYNVNLVRNYIISGTPATVGGYDRLGIGRAIRSITYFNPINGTIARLTYWPKRLSNAQLQTLTK